MDESDDNLPIFETHQSQVKERRTAPRVYKKDIRERVEGKEGVK